ncbi:MAG: methylenetetrahydrofolate reductase C-terminal domain-containing protein [Pseudomonadota bacterium]
MPLLFDKLVKGPLFGCRQCGQCLLSQTAYVCPMTCPKGLRNGPCGGTLDGACEVLPEQPCVWLNIRERGGPDDGLHRPFDPRLVGTSSLGNFVTGRDRPTRVRHGYRSRPATPDAERSVLARRFDRDEPVVTYEIASPRTRSGLQRVAGIVESVRHCVDGINTTTNAGGVPSLHSLETARVVAAGGAAPIVQFCGRDQNAAEFRKQVDEALRDGFANILALTGDWNPQTERTRSPAYWFPMDSLQMVDILAGTTEFLKRPFVGVASTPYTTPMAASIERLRAKIAAGADFTQTQVVTEPEIFAQWLAAVRATAEGRAVRILPSVPLIGKPKPLEVLRRLPGVRIAPEFGRALEIGSDLPRAGLAAARQLIGTLLELDIDGLHLMNFGVPVEAAVDLVQAIRSRQVTSAA